MSKISDQNSRKSQPCLQDLRMLSRPSNGQSGSVDFRVANRYEGVPIQHGSLWARDTIITIRNLENSSMQHAALSFRESFPHDTNRTTSSSTASEYRMSDQCLHKILHLPLHLFHNSSQPEARSTPTCLHRLHCLHGSHDDRCGKRAGAKTSARGIVEVAAATE